MSRFSQAIYEVANSDKYIGTKAPYYRSSWERKFMEFCDSHPSIIKWASENVKIPYRNPVTGKYANYVPDFMIQYVDKTGTEHVELIEIKPANQTTLENAKGKHQALSVAVNAAKWQSAQEWCQRKGIRFKVINEDQIFSKPKARNPKPRIPKKRRK